MAIMRFFRTWYGISAALIVMIAIAVGIGWWTIDSSVAGVNLDGAQKACHASAQSGLDNTRSDLEGPRLEQNSSGDLKEISCLVDADVGEWHVPEQDMNLYASVDMTLSPKDALQDSDQEDIEKDCTSSDSSIEEFNGAAACVTEEQDGSATVVSSVAQVTNVRVEISIDAYAQADDPNARPELDSNGVSRVNEVHEAMLVTALSELEKRGSN